MESEGICSVRKFVDILDAGDINLNESPAPEEDELAVRLMTAHSSKGLEFPMVIVTGFAGKPHQVTGPLENSCGDLFVKFKDVQPIGFDELSENEKIQEEKEAMRLLYVAMTRAKDHLIVNASTHKFSNKLMKKHIKPKANAEALGKILSYSDQTWPQNENTFKCENTFDLLRWNQVVQAENRTTPTQLAHATDLMAGKLFPEEEFNNLESIDSQEVTEDGPTMRPTAKEAVHFGRAVHLALQTIDFRNPDLNAVSEIASTLFQSDQDRLKEFVHRALSTLILQEAANSGNNLWREAYVATVRDDNQLLEGIVDLVYELSDGTLAVADYKTDKVSNQAEADERMERSYKKQGAAYRELLSSATGKEVSTVSFIFLNLNPPYVCEVNP
jgi:ATP-dependent helicase/nuclease subunit A